MGPKLKEINSLRLITLSVGILILSMAWGSRSYSAEPALPQTPDDFRAWTSLHITRVVIRAMRLVANHGDQFKYVDRKHRTQSLSTSDVVLIPVLGQSHDLPKVLELSDLTHFPTLTQTLTEPYHTTLFHWFGVSQETKAFTLAEEQNIPQDQALRQIRTEFTTHVTEPMEIIENSLQMTVRKLLSDSGVQIDDGKFFALIRAISIADKTDRWRYGAPELGRPMSSTTTFLEEVAIPRAQETVNKTTKGDPALVLYKAKVTELRQELRLAEFAENDPNSDLDALTYDAFVENPSNVLANAQLAIPLELVRLSRCPDVFL